MGFLKNMFSKLKSFVKKETKVIETKIAYEYSAHHEEYNHVHKVCLALFLLQLCKRTTNANFSLTGDNLRQIIHASLRYASREVINDLLAHNNVVGIALNLYAAVSYLKKVIISNEARQKFIKDSIALAKELKSREEIEKYIISVLGPNYKI